MSGGRELERAGGGLGTNSSTGLTGQEETRATVCQVVSGPRVRSLIGGGGDGAMELGRWS